MSERICDLCGCSGGDMMPESNEHRLYVDCATALRTRLTTAERELAEARAALETERACHEECCRQADASDTTRREWEVRAAESWKVGRDVGRSTALADVTRCMAEVADVPDDCTALVTLIADTIARADRESHTTGRAAGLREAMGACAMVSRCAESVAWVNAAEECVAQIRALAPPAAETVVARG